MSRPPMLIVSRGSLMLMKVTRPTNQSLRLSSLGRGQFTNRGHGRQEVVVFAVQCRINGTVIDEERCLTLSEARDAIDRRRRVLVNAGAAIIAEDAYRSVIARTVDGWVTVMIVDGAPH